MKGTFEVESTGELRIRSTPRGLQRVLRSIPPGLTSGMNTRRRFFEPAIERAVDRQAFEQIFQKMQQYVGANPLKAMYAAEKTDGRDSAIWIAQADRVHRQ